MVGYGRSVTVGGVEQRIRFAPGDYPFLLVLAATAIYGCVPETDQMPTIGALIVGLFVVEVVTRERSAVVVSIVATLIVLWSGLYGATGRGSAVVGAWFAFWPILLVLAFGVAVGPVRPMERLAIGLIGGSAAVAVARTGGIEPTVTPALIAVAVAAPVSVVLAGGVVAVRRRWLAAARPG